MLTLQQFIDKYTGQFCGDTPENYKECVGLIEVWTNSLGLPHTWGNAKDLLSNADRTKFDVVINQIDNQPLKGDVLVWGTAVGPDGHTAIYIQGDTMNFKSFDQNWPVGSPCHVQDHTYTGVTGWVHPKNINLQQPMTDVSLPDYLKYKDYYDALVQHNSSYTTADAVLKDLSAKDGVIGSKDAIIAGLNEQIDQLNQAIKAVPAQTIPAVQPSLETQLADLTVKCQAECDIRVNEKEQEMLPKSSFGKGLYALLMNLDEAIRHDKGN